MRTALIANLHSYAAREYMAALRTAGLAFEVISIGSYPETNEMEEERCGGLWKPPAFEEVASGSPRHHFASLSSAELFSFLQAEQFDLGIQGGTGILKPGHFNSFRLGLLSFHPGDLPFYRGCSAPEWQVYEGKPVTSTCHLVNEGIDTGPIYRKKQLAVATISYEAMRASIYPQTARFVAEIIGEIVENQGFITPPVPQNEEVAIYRPYIGEEKRTELRENFADFIRKSQMQPA